MKRNLLFTMAFLLIFGLTGVLYAESNKPVDLVADSIEYDSTQGIITATGSVQITQDNAVLTGPSVQYNTKTRDAVATGGARVVREESVLTAAEIRSYNDNHLIAEGDAVLVKGDNRLSGPQIDYFADRQYALVPENAHLSMPDGVMTSDKLEAFFDQDQAVGSGNVHIVSDTRKLDATSDTATYYGVKSGKDGKVVLNGNAHAVQDGNTLTGNTLTIYLDDKAMDASGRPRMVIIPEQKPQQPQSQQPAK